MACDRFLGVFVLCSVLSQMDLSGYLRECHQRHSCVFVWVSIVDLQKIKVLLVRQIY